MTQPTQIVIPGADFTAQPLAWVLPTSVAPAYLGVFGSSLARTLANGASVASAPATVLGTAPAISAGYASFSAFPEAGLQSGQADALNWTWMGVIQGVGLANPGNVSVFGDRNAGPFSNIAISFNNANNLGLVQTLSPSGIVGVSINLTASVLQTWGLYVFTGTSGTGITAQNLTTGQSHMISPEPNTNAFATGGPTMKIGTTTGATSSVGTTNASMMGFWTSVLSSQDQGLAAAWMRKLALKGGITV